MIKLLCDLLHSFLSCKLSEDVAAEEKRSRKKALDDMNAAISALAKLFPSKFRIQDSRLVRQYIYTYTICIYVYMFIFLIYLYIYAYL